MIKTSRRIIVLLAVALAPLGAQVRQPIPTDACKLEYQRADNMWAAAGRADGNLGVETVSAHGMGKIFVTDWKFEKLRNDGRTYYGSHLRIAKNVGTRELMLTVKGPVHTEFVSLQPGQSQQFQHDLSYVRCTS